MGECGLAEHWWVTMACLAAADGYKCSRATWKAQLPWLPLGPARLSEDDLPILKCSVASHDESTQCLAVMMAKSSTSTTETWYLSVYIWGCRGFCACRTTIPTFQVWKCKFKNMEPRYGAHFQFEERGWGCYARRCPISKDAGFLTCDQYFFSLFFYARQTNILLPVTM